MTKAEVKHLQRELNEFTKERLHNIAPLRIDGDLGVATRRRVRRVKFWLGYRHPIVTDIDHRFRMRLRYPRRLRYTNPVMMRRGSRRRVRQREHSEENQQQGNVTRGVQTFDGRPCASWMVPYLKWARAHGWQGHLVSGWRDPIFSERLCLNMCGAVRCAGRCAGRASNHSGSVKPRGALDVSSYTHFGQLMQQCPYSPKLVNRLGQRDPVHYSQSGV